MRDYTTTLGLTWIATYQNTDQLWLLDSLNWEKTSTLVASDWSVVSFIFNSSFISSHFVADTVGKLTYLDSILLNTVSFGSSYQSLYLSFVNDNFVRTLTNHLPFQALLQAEFQDLFNVATLISPELTTSMADLGTSYMRSSSINFSPSAIADSYTSNLNFFVSDGTIGMLFFFFYVWFLVYISTTNLSLRWTVPVGNQFARLYYYLFSLVKETRMQFEAALQTILFIVLYWAMVIMAFDDDQEEFIEFVDSGFFTFFTALILFLGFKYSVHYFAFLEASVAEGRSVSFVTKQFFKDFLNTFSLLLRFYVLLFRINVYDSLDDFFDSYYIFVGDFDDDEYLNELFLSLHGTIFFTLDNNDDRSFLLEDENDFSNDFFHTYFVVWGKLMFFLFFTVEEIARLGLAFYICYLIIFEVHSVNCSYREDNYLARKRL